MAKSVFDSITVAFLMRSASYRAVAGQMRAESRSHNLFPQPSQSPQFDEQQQTRDLVELQKALQPEPVAIAVSV